LLLRNCEMCDDPASHTVLASTPRPRSAAGSRARSADGWVEQPALGRCNTGTGVQLAQRVSLPKVRVEARVRPYCPLTGTHV
jgi:hypothetical protein